MAIISTFELLAKRIGPPVGVPPQAPFRRLLQGYFLTVANPNNRNITLRMQAIIPRLNSCSPFSEKERELVGGNSTLRNHVYAYDRTGCNNNVTAAPRELFGSMFFRSSNASSKTFSTGSFRLAPFQTGIVNILPDPAAIADPAPQLEIRGYTEIVQVQRIIILGGNIQFITPPPVDLLFTPEIRGTFVDDNFTFSGPNGNLDFDQSNYALPTSEGKGIIKVTKAVNPFIIVLPDNGGVVDGGFARLEFDPDDITGEMNSLDEFVLDNKAIRKIRKKAKDLKLGKEAILTVKQQLERQVNELMVIEED